MVQEPALSECWRARVSNPLDAGAGERTPQHVRGVRFDSMKNLFGVHAIVGNGDRGHYGILPGIEKIDFGYGHVEALSETVFEALDDVPFFLQRMRMLNVDIERQDTDSRHGLGRAAAAERGDTGAGNCLLRRGRRHLRRNAFHRERFQNVADLDVIKVSE